MVSHPQYWLVLLLLLKRGSGLREREKPGRTRWQAHADGKQRSEVDAK
jgi:hypothetical protein